MSQDPLHTVATLPPFDLYTLKDDDTVVLSHRVHPALVLAQLVIAQGAEYGAAATIGALRLEWGRWSSLQARVQAVSERQLRTWKAQVYVDMCKAAEIERLKLTDAELKKPIEAKAKPPTKDAWENEYRVHPEYAGLQRLVEAVTESAASTAEIVQAVASKKEGIRAIATMTAQGA